MKVEEVRPILNNFIDKKLNELYNHEDYDKEKKSSKNEKLINDIVEVHKITLEENLIEIVNEDKDSQDPGKGKKPDKTLWILYKAKKVEEVKKTRSFRKINMIDEKEKLDEIKNYLGMLLDLWEGGNPSNKEIRSAFKINTMSEYKELVEELREDGNEKEAKGLLDLINRLENE